MIVGEQGSYVDPKKPRPPGVGGVWDPRLALRIRTRIRAAFFNEISIVLWNTSYARDGHSMNIRLGREEREYVRALQCFAYSRSYPSPSSIPIPLLSFLQGRTLRVFRPL